MNACCQKLFRTVKNRDGFTLIEMLIVIIILGILAMVIIPQITVSTDDAKVSTLKTNLTGMRSAIEIYYGQHNNTYPGVATAGTGYGDVNTALAFVSQLTLYSNAAGAVSPTKDVNFPFGPYIKGASLPSNPFRTTTVTNDVLPDTGVTSITLAAGAARVSDGTTAWKYLPVLGIIFANDEVSATTDTTKVHKTY